MKKTKKNDLKILEGDFKKDRVKKNIPRMPRGLSPDSKRWWKKMVRTLDSSILLPGDRIALMLLCDALAIYERVKKRIEEVGQTYQTIDEDGNKITLMRPEVEIENMYFKEIFSLLKEFQLTPNSRTVVRD